MNLLKLTYIRIVLLFLFMAATANAQAQSSFSLSPRVYSKPISINQTSDMVMYVKNHTNGDLKIRWRKLMAMGDFGWDMMFCNNGNCMLDIPAQSPYALTVPNGAMFYVGVMISPMGIKGTGKVQVYVYVDGHESDGDTATWLINAVDDGAAIQNVNAGTTPLTLYPDPAADVLNIQGLAARTTSVSIYNMAGEEVYTRPYSDAMQSSDVISIAGLPAGMYILRSRDAMGGQGIARFTKMQ